ncbi:hypothetical protein CH361_06375 [Leptospira brenneri]|nr:hypothetical protein CH361_06375 [Leptospira brenneri]
MKTTLIVLSGILSFILWGLVLSFSLVILGNFIEEGLIEKLPISFVTSTYIHLILLILFIFYSFKKRTKQNWITPFFLIIILTNLISLATLILSNPQVLNVQKKSLDFLSKWNLTDVIFYSFVYIKTILSIF